MKGKGSAPARRTDRIFGGAPMGWPVVLLLAVGTAILTVVFLLFPVFQNTSFERMGVHLEAWIFFAVVIMSNCRRPLESACKTFVFFLVSQPLIYLLQVPFSALGWGLFRFYKTWFVWTLLTFPMACVGWYITRRNTLSLLILLPVLCLLAYTGAESLQTAARHPPRLIVTALFCLGQVFLYPVVFTEKRWQKLVGVLVPLAAAAILLLAAPRIALESTQFLPDEPVLSASADVTVEDPAFAAVSLERIGADSMIRVKAERFGSTVFTIRDGGEVYRYTLTIHEEEGGHTQVEITPAA